MQNALLGSSPKSLRYRLLHVAARLTRAWGSSASNLTHRAAAVILHAAQSAAPDLLQTKWPIAAGWTLNEYQTRSNKIARSVAQRVHIASPASVAKMRRPFAGTVMRAEPGIPCMG